MAYFFTKKMSYIFLRNLNIIFIKFLRCDPAVIGNCNFLKSRMIHDTKKIANNRYPMLQKLQENYQIRSIMEKDIPRILEIRQSLGSHDCHSCLQTLYKLDPEGILIAENEIGEIVGIVSFINYTDDFSAGGFFYVKPEMRKAGLGKKIFQAGLKHCHNRNIAGQIPITVTKMYQNMIPVFFRESFSVLKHITHHDVNPELLSDKLPNDVRVHLFEEHQLQSLYDYDLELLGFDRRRLLELSCKEENSMTFVAMKSKKCLGFGTIKLSCLGAKRVGPLYADDDSIAEALLKVLLQSFSMGKGFVMITLSSNLMASSLMKKLNVPSTQYLIQILTKQLVEVDTNKVYAHFDVNSSAF